MKAVCSALAASLVLGSLAGCDDTVKDVGSSTLAVVDKPQPQHHSVPYPIEGYDSWIREITADRVFFAYDSSNLEVNARITLDTWVKTLKAQSGLNLIIEGHCDERGTREYNLALGQRRAEAVRSYLIAHGIPAIRLKVISYGKERPSVRGSAEEVWAQNRNVIGIRN